MNSWNNNILSLKTDLESIIVTDISNHIITPDLGFELLVKYTIDVRNRKGRAFFIGNGASASMASHFSADLGKNAHVFTEVFTDISMITAYANDISYEEVFSAPLKHRMEKDDMIIAISSSGNSPNIVKAVETAKTLDGFIATLSAMSQKNKIRQIGNLNFYVPSQTYGMAETCHSAILHHWIDRVISII